MNPVPLHWTRDFSIFSMCSRVIITPNSTYMLPEEINVWAQCLWISLLNKPDDIIN